jgi:hypothetical protein
VIFFGWILGALFLFVLLALVVVCGLAIISEGPEILDSYEKFLARWAEFRDRQRERATKRVAKREQRAQARPGLGLSVNPARPPVDPPPPPAFDSEGIRRGGPDPHGG